MAAQKNSMCLKWSFLYSSTASWDFISISWKSIIPVTFNNNDCWFFFFFFNPEKTNIKWNEVYCRVFFSFVPLIDPLTTPFIIFFFFLNPFSTESLKDLVAMEVDGQADVKSELPTPPASDVGSPTSFSHCGSDSEPDSPMGEDTKVCRAHLN